MCYVVTTYTKKEIRYFMSLFSEKLLQKASDFVKLAKSKNLKLATAESCTGGLLSGLITSVSGSSDVFDRGFVTYATKSKTDMINVNRSIIEKHTVFSEEVAEAMAKGCVNNSDADIGVGITGIAGPNGGSENQPVGLVYISVFNSKNDKVEVSKNIFSGSRDEVRLQAVEKALDMLKNIMN